jgi:hypothetical protein
MKLSLFLLFLYVILHTYIPSAYVTVMRLGIGRQLSEHISKITFDLWIINGCPSSFVRK